MPDFYIAPVNEDGTYGELQKWEGVKEITPITEPSSAEIPLHFTQPGIVLESENPTWMLFALSYFEKSKLKSCSTCRNCMEMYHYPDFVTAEECECTEGLECDTWFGKVKNCPKYEVLPYGEPHPRNPDLDKYIYVLKGE